MAITSNLDVRLRPSSDVPVIPKSKRKRKFSWRRAVPRWTSLHAIANGAFGRVLTPWAVIVPAIAKVTSKLPDEIRIAVGEHSYVLTNSLPFSWKCLFYASLFALIARIITFVACPKICKRHYSYGSFRDAGLTQTHLSQFCAEAGCELPIKLAGTNSMFGQFEEPHTPEEESYLKWQFWLTLQCFNGSRFKTRLVAALFAAIAALLATVVFLEGSWYVLSYAGGM